MDYSKTILVLSLMLATTALYTWVKGDNEEQKQADMNSIREFLVGERRRFILNKPIVWVHTEYPVNSRSWDSFCDRNTTEVNQPYLNMSVSSIIDRSSKNMNVCLIDDDSFEKLIPGWDIDLSIIGDPVKNHLRSLALMKVLYLYGGMIVPNGYYALQDVNNMFDMAEDCFVIETPNRSVRAQLKPFFPNHRFMGCKRNSPVMKELITYAEYLNSHDYTSAQDFQGSINSFLFKLIREKKMNYVDGKYVGVIDADGKAIEADDLFGDVHLNLVEGVQGILIPQDEILKRYKFQWFAGLTPAQIRSSEFILAKYLA